MANEATVADLLSVGGEVIQMTCADATGIEKGTILKLSGDRTVAASSADGDIFGGIAAAEKVASDGSTTIPVYTRGIFDLVTDSATQSVGDILKISGANIVAAADDDVAEHGSQGFCVLLEAAAANERCLCKLGHTI